MTTKVYCEDCERKVKPEPIPINHIFYLLITLISFGIGFIFWGIAAMSTNDRYRCPLCKDDVTKLYSDARDQVKAQEKQEDKEFQEKYGLSWKMRVPVFIAYSAIIYALYVFDTPEFPIAWYVYMPFVLAALFSITGSDLFSVRDIIEERDFGQILVSVFFVAMFMLVGLVAEAIFVTVFLA